MTPQDTKAPQSCTNESRRATIRPSRVRPSSTSCHWSRSWVTASRCSRRVSMKRTGRPSDAGEERDQDVFGVDDGLGPEAAADVLGDDAHRVLGKAEVAREETAQDLRRLRRRPHGDLSEVGVPAGGDGARLHGHAGAAVQVEALAQDDLGAARGAPAGSPTRWVKREATLPPGWTRGPSGRERVLERGDERPAARTRRGAPRARPRPGRRSRRRRAPPAAPA